MYLYVGTVHKRKPLKNQLFVFSAAPSPLTSSGVWVWAGVCGFGQGCVGLGRGVWVWEGVCGFGQGCVGLGRGVWLSLCLYETKQMCTGWRVGRWVGDN